MRRNVCTLCGWKSKWGEVVREWGEVRGIQCRCGGRLAVDERGDSRTETGIPLEVQDRLIGAALDVWYARTHDDHHRFLGERLEKLCECASDFMREQEKLTEETGA